MRTREEQAAHDLKHRMNTTPEYMTVKEIAEIVKLSPKHVAYRLPKEDPHFPRATIIGRSRRYPKHLVLAWLAKLDAKSAR